jgi:hypothetical protein
LVGDKLFKAKFNQNRPFKVEFSQKQTGLKINLFKNKHLPCKNYQKALEISINHSQKLSKPKHTSENMEICQLKQ